MKILLSQMICSRKVFLNEVAGLPSVTDLQLYTWVSGNNNFLYTVMIFMLYGVSISFQYI